MKKIIIGIIVVMMGFCVNSAYAVPALQLYVEGASYNPVTESWELATSNFVLWVLGNVGAYGTIYDVQLVTAFDTSETGTITFTPTTATSGQLPSPGDSSTPIDPVVSGSGADSAPLMGDGSPLPSHGEYGPGISWNTYDIGDFGLTDSPIGDYIDTPPTDFPELGQINAYNVSVTGYTNVHFDAYDHYTTSRKVKYVFAPFSHDASMIPEPATMALLGIGLAGLIGLRKKK